MMNAQKKFDELRHKKEEVVEEVPAEPEETELSILKEIRDSLKKD
jgi:large-conductance mechanosensitive channel